MVRVGKESACQWRRLKRCRFDSWVGKIPWRRKWQMWVACILAGRILWTEEPGGLQPRGSQRVRYNWASEQCLYHIHLTEWRFCTKQVSVSFIIISLLHMRKLSFWKAKAERIRTQRFHPQGPTNHEYRHWCSAQRLPCGLPRHFKEILVPNFCPDSGLNPESFPSQRINQAETLKPAVPLCLQYCTLWWKQTWKAVRMWGFLRHSFAWT